MALHIQLMAANRCRSRRKARAGKITPPERSAGESAMGKKRKINPAHIGFMENKY